MPSMLAPIEGTCSHCNKRPATDRFLTEGMDGIHGGVLHWCHKCVLEYQINFIEKAAANLPRLKDELAAEILKYHV